MNWWWFNLALLACQIPVLIASSILLRKISLLQQEVADFLARIDAAREEADVNLLESRNILAELTAQRERREDAE